MGLTAQRFFIETRTALGYSHLSTLGAGIQNCENAIGMEEIVASTSISLSHGRVVRRVKLRDVAILRLRRAQCIGSAHEVAGIFLVGHS